MGDVIITRRGSSGGGGGEGNGRLVTDIIAGGNVNYTIPKCKNNTISVFCIGAGTNAVGTYNQYTTWMWNSYSMKGSSGWLANEVFTNLTPNTIIPITCLQQYGSSVSFGTYLSANGADNTGGGAGTGGCIGYQFGGGTDKDGGVWGGGGGSQAYSLNGGNGGIYGGGGGLCCNYIGSNNAQPGNGGTYGGGGGGYYKYNNGSTGYSKKGIGGTYGGNGGFHNSRGNYNANNGTNTMNEIEYPNVEFRGMGLGGLYKEGNSSASSKYVFIGGGGGGYGGNGGNAGAYVFSTSGDKAPCGGGGGYGGNGGDGQWGSIRLSGYGQETGFGGGGGGYGGDGGNGGGGGGYGKVSKGADFYYVGAAGGGYYCPANKGYAGGFGLWFDNVMYASYGSGGQYGACIIQYYL